jgi:hypothetical protein
MRPACGKAATTTSRSTAATRRHTLLLLFEDEAAVRHGIRDERSTAASRSARALVES